MKYIIIKDRIDCPNKENFFNDNNIPYCTELPYIRDISSGLIRHTNTTPIPLKGIHKDCPLNDYKEVIA